MAGQKPSSNWLSLRQKILPAKRKRPKPQSRISSSPPTNTTTEFARGHANDPDVARHEFKTPDDILAAARGDFSAASIEYLKNLGSTRSNSLVEMRDLVQGTYLAPGASEAAKKAGKYVALDCEMVGVGEDGRESSLARVSLVDYHGAVLLDAFVRQRERVSDWRTSVSGVREEDMRNARLFQDVQREVSKLLEGRVLVGHALSNDMQALLLSHPRNMMRDTQHYCGKLRLAGTRPALRSLARLHFGLDIQGGEHSSVTDARAAMGIYRIHARDWEQVLRRGSQAPVVPVTVSASQHTKDSTPESKKRKRTSFQAEARDGILLHLAGSEDDEVKETEAKRPRIQPPPIAAPKKLKAKVKEKGKTRISSGLSTVVRSGAAKTADKRAVGIKGGTKGGGSSSGGDWWKTLGGSKHAMKI